MRLQRFLAQAGVASRRASERLIEDGRVTVNGATITTLGSRVDPERDAVKVDGRRIHAPRGSHAYVMLHKPRECVTTLSDPEGRPTVADLLPDSRARLFPVGRLDFHSEGLLLLTDDGDLAHSLTHPRHRVPKTYVVKVRGNPGPEALARVRRGVVLEGRRTAPAQVRVTRPGSNAWLEVTVTEGRKHLVRNLLAAVGHPVTRLRRVAIGDVALGGLPVGRSRPLEPDEIASLKAAGRPSRRPPDRR